MKDLVIFYRCEPSPQLLVWLERKELEHLYLDKEIYPADVKGNEAKKVVIDADKYEDIAISCKALKVKIPSLDLIVTSHDLSLEPLLKIVGVNTFLLKKPVEYELISALEPSLRKGTSVLTQREEEVMNLLILGHTSRNIAEILGISIKSIDAHRTRIYRKMGASNVASLTFNAIKAGLVSI